MGGKLEFPRICIIGVGLIGGSIASAAKRLDPRQYIVGIDTDASSLEFALEHDLIDEGATPADPVVNSWLGADGAGGLACDLVLLATPASSAEEWFQVLGASGFEGVITDVASTKRKVLEAAQRHLKDPGAFVGGHPMAGSEVSGVTAARPDLFKGAYYVLTPTRETNAEAFRKLHAFVGSLGARVLSVDANEHDSAVAIVSHVPHVTASALVDLAKMHAGEGDELLRLAAGGFKDTTRIAAGSPDLWTGICLDNADAIADGVDELVAVLSDFADKVRARDGEALRAWLAHAADVRRALPAQWVPATERLTEVIIPMVDRPGVISEVTAAVGRAGCNIEAIEIDHISEDTALLVLALTDEGDFDRLFRELVSCGYDPLFRPIEPLE